MAIHLGHALFAGCRVAVIFLDLRSPNTFRRSPDLWLFSMTTGDQSLAERTGAKITNRHHPCDWKTLSSIGVLPSKFYGLLRIVARGLNLRSTCIVTDAYSTPKCSPHCQNRFKTEDSRMPRIASKVSYSKTDSTSSSLPTKRIVKTLKLRVSN